MRFGEARDAFGPKPDTGDFDGLPLCTATVEVGALTARRIMHDLANKTWCEASFWGLVAFDPHYREHPDYEAYMKMMAGHELPPHIHRDMVGDQVRLYVVDGGEKRYLGG